MITARSTSLPETTILRLNALTRQIKHGPLAIVLSGPPDNPAASLNPMQIENWRVLGYMTEDIAKRTFLSELYAFAPYWKYEKFL